MCLQKFKRCLRAALARSRILSMPGVRNVIYLYRTSIKAAFCLPKPYIHVKYFLYTCQVSLARPYTGTNFPCNACPKTGMTIALEQPNKTPWQEKIVKKFFCRTHEQTKLLKENVFVCIWPLDLRSTNQSRN